LHLEIFVHDEPTDRKRDRTKHEPRGGFLILYPKRDARILERSFRERDREPVVGLENHCRLRVGLPGWGQIAREQSHMAIGTLREAVAIFHSALRTINGCTSSLLTRLSAATIIKERF
jgi:hypothetical protein